MGIAVRGGPADPVKIVNLGTVDGGVNSPAVVTAAGTILIPNSQRRVWWLQNLGTNPLYVKLGAGASTSDFDLILKASTVADDGSGGFISDEVHKGTVSVAGTSPRCAGGELNE